ncbi:hypothetical protein R5M92_03170 [Halomonas sp. Bachu 37]|uniref:hypothetical protein n=1 Tax=Halomonas kashgarensis TaxID=3084920 RepID=UPI003218085D
MKLSIWTHPLHLVMGLTLWSAWFVTMYGGHAVVCSVAPPATDQGPFTWLNVVLGLLTVASAAGLGLLAWRCLGASRHTSVRAAHFCALVSAGLYLTSAVAVLFVGVPVIGVPPCL